MLVAMGDKLLSSLLEEILVRGIEFGRGTAMFTLLDVSVQVPLAATLDMSIQLGLFSMYKLLKPWEGSLASAFSVGFGELKEVFVSGHISCVTSGVTLVT